MPSEADGDDPPRLAVRTARLEAELLYLAMDLAFEYPDAANRLRRIADAVAELREDAPEAAPLPGRVSLGQRWKRG